MRLSSYHVVAPPVVDADDVPKRVVFATRTAQTRVVTDETWQHITSGAIDQLPADTRRDLASIELLVADDDRELHTILDRNRRAAVDNPSLVLVIQPTAMCQLGCDYCGQLHSSKWLSPSHQEEFIERARIKLSARRYQHLRISWFGAEPLSGLTVIRSLTPRLQALAEQAGCAYGASMTTNGLALTPAIATEIVDTHMIHSLTISLDGTAEAHDARRPTKKGGGTFEAIFANVVALARRRDLDVEINIRANVDRRNADSIVPLLHQLADAGIQDRIRFYVVPIHAWGNDAHLKSMSPEEFAACEIDWFAEMIRLGFQTGLLPPRKPLVCIAVMPEAEVIDATGALYNCTEVSYVPFYGTPNTFAIGHVSAGETAGKRIPLASFNDRVAAGALPCTTCRMLPVCGGACPKSWMEGHEPCPSAKRNIEQRLVLSYGVTRLQTRLPRTGTDG